MKVFWVGLALCAIWSVALGTRDLPPPVPPSYHFGITGEATKVDTAFGNLGNVGPVYSNTPGARNNSVESSMGLYPTATEAGSKVGQVKQSTGPLPTVKSTTTSLTEKFSTFNPGDVTTAKTFHREEIRLPGLQHALNGTTQKGSESSTGSSQSQTIETTTMPTGQTTGSSNTTNEYEDATKNPEHSSFMNPDSEPSLHETGADMAQQTPDITSTLSTTSLTSSISSSSPPSQGARLNTTQPSPNAPLTSPNSPSSQESRVNTTQPTSDVKPDQSFITGLPNTSTDSPISPHRPSKNDTRPDQNMTLLTNPNSSASLYVSIVHRWLWLGLVGLSFYMNT